MRLAASGERSYDIVYVEIKRRASGCRTASRRSAGRDREAVGEGRGCLGSSRPRILER